MSALKCALPGALMVSCVMLSGNVQALAPGGIVEPIETTDLRPPPTREDILRFMPERGEFTFPAPFNTLGVRITNSSDCGGGDCVEPAGYAYWRNINNHRGSDTMLIMVGLRRGRGGAGPSLFEYNKVTGQLVPRGPLFSSDNPLSSRTGEGWYFSATLPTKLYLHDGTRLRRYDVLSKEMETVFDIGTTYGSGAYLWQAHSSDDDRVHSATVRSSSGVRGCVTYDAQTEQMRLHESRGSFDECQVDASGRWLLIKENVDGRNGEDNRIIDLVNGSEQLLLDEQGAAGHSDNGHGYLVAADNWANEPGSVRLWQFDDLTRAPVVYHSLSWDVGVTHVTHTNARADLAPEDQFACTSHVGPHNVPRANEIVCFLLNEDDRVLAVAPVMTSTAAAGGGSSYRKLPKANLDPTGEYVFWTSNLVSNRLDAFMARVPAHHLYPDGVEPPDDTSDGDTVNPPSGDDRFSGSGSPQPEGCNAAGVPALPALLIFGLYRRRASMRKRA